MQTRSQRKLSTNTMLYTATDIKTAIKHPQEITGNDILQILQNMNLLNYHHANSAKQYPFNKYIVGNHAYWLHLEIPIKAWKKYTNTDADNVIELYNKITELYEGRIDYYDDTDEVIIISETFNGDLEF